jgi:arsenate reductase
MQVTIWHNPRCRKSREGLEALQERESDIRIRLYMRDKPSLAELEEVFSKSGLGVDAHIRHQEKKYKELGLNEQQVNDAKRKEAMLAYPQLIERPIVIRGEKAVIARPAAKIEELY